MIQSFFKGVGHLSNQGKDTVRIQVTLIKDLTNVIIPFLTITL
jgi:hypothetical protein